MKLVAACVAAALLAGCKSDPKITGVRIVAQFGAIDIDQIEFNLDLMDGQTRAPIRRPEPPGASLSSSQDLVIYLPDTMASKPVTCQAAGVRAGKVVSRGIQHVVTVLLHKVVTCPIRVDEQVLSDAGALPDARVVIIEDSGIPADGSVLPPDALAADAPLPRDVLVPGVEVSPPPPDGAPPPPDVAVLPPDAPQDTATPPVDLPLPPDAAPITGCAGNAARTAFISLSTYPNIASCGSAVSYNTALGTGKGACATGWHWCKAEEVGNLAGAHPGTVAGATCSWVDGSQAPCGDKRTVYPRAGCTGSSKMQSIGGPPTTNLPCLGTDIGCMEAWKLAVSFDRWDVNSVTGVGGGCLEHLDIKCTGMADGASCWTTCCKDP